MSILIRGITIEQFYKDLNTVDDMDIGWDIRQLPPHGRLIDADELIKDECNHCDGECEIVDCDCLGCKNHHCRCDFIKGVLEMPTVVEAEGESNEYYY